MLTNHALSQTALLQMIYVFNANNMDLVGRNTLAKQHLFNDRENIAYTICNCRIRHTPQKCLFCNLSSFNVGLSFKISENRNWNYTSLITILASIVKCLLICEYLMRSV